MMYCIALVAFSNYGFGVTGARVGDIFEGGQENLHCWRLHGLTIQTRIQRVIRRNTVRSQPQFQKRFPCSSQ